MPISHGQAAQYVYDGFLALFGREPSESEILYALAVARGESNYGDGWKGAGVGSNNVGAIQAKLPPCDPEKHFVYTDSRPQADGTSKKYEVCFKKYPSLSDGFLDLVKVLYRQRPSVLKAASGSTVIPFSAAMYDTKYYEGFGPTREDRIRSHASAIASHYNAISKALGWESRVTSGGFVPSDSSEPASMYLAPFIILGAAGALALAWRKKG